MPPYIIYIIITVIYILNLPSLNTDTRLIIYRNHHYFITCTKANADQGPRINISA